MFPSHKGGKGFPAVRVENVSQSGWETFPRRDGEPFPLGIGNISLQGWETFPTRDGKCFPVGMGNVSKLRWETFPSRDGKDPQCQIYQNPFFDQPHERILRRFDSSWWPYLGHMTSRYQKTWYGTKAGKNGRFTHHFREEFIFVKMTIREKFTRFKKIFTPGVMG